MMKPELSVQASPMHAEVRASYAKSPSGSFSEYVERKMNAGLEKQEGLLNAKAVEKTKPSRENDGEGDGEVLTVAGLLYGVMEELLKIVGESEAPGVWSVDLSDLELLKKIAMDAGMSEEDIALLLQQMEAEDGKLGLDDFLAAFMRHFETMDDVRPITVPETDLPFLETLLSKMGVSVEEITKISDSAVTGDARLDLALFLKGLESIEGAHPITLSDWEVEQLNDLLAKAGVSEGLQKSMLWERGFTKVALGLDRLKNLLTQGINEIESGRPFVDLPVFRADLKQLLSQAGFEHGGVGWSPVVQKSLEAVYKELVELVDLSTVQVSRVNPTIMTQESEEAEIDLEGLDGNAEETDGYELFSESTFMDHDKGLTGQRGDKHQDMLNSSGSTILSRHESLAGNTGTPNFEITAGDARPHVMTHRMPPQMQQQAFDQISQGVLKGINNNDNHLILKLYPPELGEVKVDLLVRNGHVALSFNMENSKVKQLLESSLDQFQESLEQKGFVLDECMISAGRDDDNNAWQRFEAAWNSKSPARVETLAGPADDVLYHTAYDYDVREGGISLFV